MDMKSSAAALGYATARPATQPQHGEDSAENTFASAAQGLSDTIRNAEQTAMSSMTGGADPHALVQALAQTELAVETAVTIRDKVVEAYQEILRMPV
ncbi:flagellar hook-basal body complex protein FliE [Rhodovulum sp. BSW8]|uniref:Flagellar hook-basal body complex protein FliE n=1 Tax=Rhodovulum visakhapatnamense TaxID=364297 RepID=A0A4R8FFX8_9RHOB|nr:MULTISPECIES: flagellar hook-basal body complex protein FliE [Rhodovulum]OLS43643.1 flagellar hook-basal body protein FliE [Rhodovulum sulfidophilum]MBL3568963.1 flagellar hook-basal body complex protein FliE [Rhodovulum visakhapatnamense]MBL3578106.1 flagellar hook-basal body complex protein FliE [Rhodovulum visakhapatnamense]RBO51204.1 flagellar hook-basal body complex protein FliE [Rhodovulum sp. BSW8]TDX24884.1 flagellar hook-basal body complex protein FliE [Rhodovulum visakhapatnamense